MKQSKLWNLLFAVLWLLQLVAEVITLMTIQRLDMLPDQYVILLVAFFLALWAIMGLMLFMRSKSGRSGLRQGTACFLVLAIVLGCAGVTTVAADVYETLHAVVQQPSIENKLTRTVYVRADDPAQTLFDAAGYTFAIVENYDTVYTQLAVEKIQQILGKEIEIHSYATVAGMVDGLYAGEVNAIILNSAYVSLLQDDQNYADFDTKTRVLCELELEEQNLPPVTQPTDPDATLPDNPKPTRPSEPTLPPIVEPEDITDHAFVVYVGGSDARSSYLTTSNNDVNILAVVNPETKQILLVNTPRDYYIANPAGGGALDKLTHCGIYGVENSMKALSELYGIRVDYYAQVNFAGFETMIDAIGGITVNSNVAFTTHDGAYYFHEGDNFMDGAKALAFARERSAFAAGDVARGQNQMKVIKAVIQKLTSGSTILSRYSEILESMKGMFKTNLGTGEMGQLVKMQLTDLASWNIMSVSVSGYDDSRYTYSMPGEWLYVMQPDYDRVAQVEELIDRVVAGEILTDADLK